MAEDKTNMIIATPIVSAFWFFGMFFVISVQVKNKNCPEGILNFTELLFAVFFGVYAIAGAVSFFASGFQSFTPILPAGVLTYSSISWAHNKRSK